MYLNAHGFISVSKPSVFFTFPPASKTLRGARFALSCLSEQTAAFAVYVINWVIFITEIKSVYSAVRTDRLYKVDCV
jgi:hypothetical protein